MAILNRAIAYILGDPTFDAPGLRPLLSAFRRQALSLNTKERPRNLDGFIGQLRDLEQTLLDNSMQDQKNLNPGNNNVNPAPSEDSDTAMKLTT